MSSNITLIGKLIESLLLNDIAWCTIYLGIKITSPGFNINSTQTIDGGPVVEILSANPSQLIYQQPSQATGNFIFNTGN